VGVIAVQNSNISIEYSRFTQCWALDVGVIQVSEYSVATFRSTHFFSNVALTNGVFRISSGSVVNMTSVIFQYNKAELMNSVG